MERRGTWRNQSTPIRGTTAPPFGEPAESRAPAFPREPSFLDKYLGIAALERRYKQILLKKNLSEYYDKKITEKREKAKRTYDRYVQLKKQLLDAGIPLALAHVKAYNRVFKKK